MSDSGVVSGADLLGVLARAERACEPREPFHIQPDTHPGALVQHPGLETGHVHCSRPDLEDLEDDGCVRITRSSHKMTVTALGPGQRPHSQSIPVWQASVTPAGFRRVDELTRVAGEARTSALGGLDWETAVLPVLRAAYEIDDRSDPELGLSAADLNHHLGREAGDVRTGRVLILLAEAGYVTETMSGPDQFVGPMRFRLAEPALRIVANWPTPGSGDQFVSRLLEVIDDRIAETEDEHERTRLERLRDTIGGIGHDIVVSVVAGVAQKYGGQML